MRNTPVSQPFFMKTSEIHPYLGYFFQKQMRYTRIPIIFDKNKRSAPVSRPFFSKTGEKHPYLGLFLPKTRERWPCYGGFNQNRSIRRAVSFVFHKNSWNRPTFSTFFLKNKRKRWAYSMIFTKNSTERWPCSVVLPTRNKKICYLQQAAYLSMWSIPLSFAKEIVLRPSCNKMNTYTS